MKLGSRTLPPLVLAVAVAGSVALSAARARAQPVEPELAGAPTDVPDDDPAALVDFRATLDPYGSWIDDPTYGTVWVPSPTAVGASFQPYVSNGHWTWDGGWVWVSDYPWGAATFHYGRWVYLDGVGWAWVPGRQYAGAWVDWRMGDGYLGWAPLPPSFVWRDGVAVPLGFEPSYPYAFCADAYVFTPSLAPYVVVGGPSSPWYTRTRPYVQQAPPAYRARGVPARLVGPPPTQIGWDPGRVPRPPARALAPEHALAAPQATPQATPRPTPQPAARPEPTLHPQPLTRPLPSGLAQPQPLVRPAPAFRAPAPSPAPAPAIRPLPPAFRPTPTPAPPPLHVPAPAFRPSPAPAPAPRMHVVIRHAR